MRISNIALGLAVGAASIVWTGGSAVASEYVNNTSVDVAGDADGEGAGMQWNADCSKWLAAAPACEGLPEYSEGADVVSPIDGSTLVSVRADATHEG